MDFFSWFISMALTIPLFSMVFVYAVVRLVVDNRKKRILWTADISTIMLILSVHFHLMTIFEKSYLFHIILGILIVLILFYYLDYKKSKIPSIYKASRKVWRLSFLVFFVGYLILMIFGVANGIMEST
ncbi:DUF3397 family protein [Metabacillus sp. HB246100]